MKQFLSPEYSRRREKNIHKHLPGKSVIAIRYALNCRDMVKRFSIMAIIFILAGGFTALPLSGVELLSDPDFSFAKAGDKSAAGLRVVSQASRTAIVEKNGKKFLRIANTKPRNTELASPLHECRVGGKVTIEAVVSGKGTLRLAMLMFSARGKYAGRIEKSFSVNGERRFTHEFTVPAESKSLVPAKIQFRFYFHGKEWDVFKISAADDQKSPDTEFLKKSIADAEQNDGSVTLPPQKLKISSVTVPAGVTIRFSKGSCLEFLPGAVMTLNGKIDAGCQQIFAGNAKFNGSPDIPEVYPQWFGAKGDDRSDDGPALQMAADLAKLTGKRKLIIPAGRYRVEQILNFSCNVDCFGVVVIPMEADPKTKRFPNYAESYRPKKIGAIFVVPDTPEIALKGDVFFGLKADSFTLPVYQDIPLRDDPDKKIALEPGGTLRLSSTDFFISRNVGVGDHVYDPTDIFEITGPQGEVFPESCFSYQKHDQAEEWSKSKVYKRGDYVKRNGVIYKASYPSGPGVVYKHRFRGTGLIGPADPAAIKLPAQWSVLRFPIKYAKGKPDRIMAWRKVMMNAGYTPPQQPLSINNLSIEVVLKHPVNEYIQITNNPAVFCMRRSHVTINNLRVENKEKFLRLQRLVSSSNCVNLTYNNLHVSGACDSAGGYNIGNGNVGNVTYNNCVSTRCRDSIAGRHGKKITINGGFFGGVIDDHYGKCYYINNAVMRPMEPWMPGYYTPKARPQEWRFVETCAIRVNGSDFTVENCRVYGGNVLFLVRKDGGDIGGRITIKNIMVNSKKEYAVFYFRTFPDFDYSRKIHLPAAATIDGITNEGGGGLSFLSQKIPGRWNINVSNCHDVTRVALSNADATFRGCTFRDPQFKVCENSKFDLQHCVIKGNSDGLAHKNICVDGKKFQPETAPRK